MSLASDTELLEQLLEYEPRASNGRDLELADPPTSDDGKLICGRERVRTSEPCGSQVGIPWTPCDRHEPLDPIVWGERRRGVSCPK